MRQIATVELMQMFLNVRTMGDGFTEWDRFEEFERSIRAEGQRVPQ